MKQLKRIDREFAINSNNFLMIVDRYHFYGRIFGYGFRIKNTRYHSLFFSERMGIRKLLRIGSWVINKV